MDRYTEEVKELLGSISDDASVPLFKKLKFVEFSVIIRLANIWRMTAPNPTLGDRSLLSNFYLTSDPKGMPYMSEGFSYMSKDARSVRVKWVESDQVYGFVLAGKCIRDSALPSASEKWLLFLFRDFDEGVTTSLYSNIERMVSGIIGV